MGSQLKMKPLLLGLVFKRFPLASYDLAKAYLVARFRCHLLLKNLGKRQVSPVIIYQMGKVGSTTIYESLQTLKGISVFHIHVLAPKSITGAEHVYRNSFSRTGKICQHLIESQYLRRQLDRNAQESKNWKIISLVRDPVAKNISAFFQMLDSVIGYDYKTQIQNQAIEVVLEDLKELFLEKFIGKYGADDNTLTWFDRELKTVFNLDVYAEEFCKNKGYKIYNSERISLLILKLENLNHYAKSALEEFLGTQNLSIKKANISSEKHYQYLYKRFLDTIILPESYLQKMYSSKYVIHFYTPKEIKDFMHKWQHS